MPFQWHPNDPPPSLQEHSKAKLDVLRRYLGAYFDKLGGGLRRDEFKLDLVDGFSGGGTYTYRDSIVSGTPLIMLEESKAAEERLNVNRTKPLRFDCRFHFVDVKADHTAHLRKVLREHGYNTDGKGISVHTSRFEEVADEIIANVRNRQPIAGRAIFLLDQTGYAKVDLGLIARILRSLRSAEVILTFASDVLVNFITKRPHLIKSLAPLQLTQSQIERIIEFRDGDGGRALSQRVLREQIRSVTGATYDTPFFIRPKHSRRALWFLHLSRHPVARDVMIQCHWNSSNTFEHYGTGDFDMLGWDALHAGEVPLFNFTELDAKSLRDQLIDSMPTELYNLAEHDPITVDAMHHALANRTAARFDDLDETVITLVREREFEIWGPDGNLRSRRLTQLDPTDRIAIPAQRKIPGLSRRQS